MDKGTLYVILDSETLFNLGTGTYNDGDSIQLNNSNRGTYYSVIGGKLYKGRFGAYDRSDNESYTIHVWGDNADYFLDYNYLVLPATILVVLFLSIIWRWFIRMRG